jgi:DNA modification methylase
VEVGVRREQIGDATLYLGDCREVLPTLGKVDAVVTDPPYGVDFDGNDWDRSFPSDEVWSACAAACGDGANVIVIPGEAGLPAKTAALFAAFSFQWVIPWYKPNAMQFGKTGFSKHNLVWWLSVGSPKHRPAMIDVIVCPMGLSGDKDIGHPSPKPLQVMTTLVENFCAAGSVVLDPFMGSGTTGVACANLGRRFIGVEIHEPYFDIACRRIEQAYRQPRLFTDKPPAPQQTSLMEVI